ncbi:MAG: histidine phosphatase family protein [Alphaproteobacteria bacterium]
MNDTVTTRWWWIRHAPVVDDGGCIYGQRDLPADCSDSASFTALAHLLPERAIWVASHLSRTHQTAEAIGQAGRAVPPLVIEPALAEQHFGDWQGRPRREIYSRHMPWPGFWITAADHRPPGGESFAEVTERVALAIARLTTHHAGQDIVAVAHGGTIRAALALALGLQPTGALAFSVENLSLTRLDHIAPIADSTAPSTWRVVAVNHVPAKMPKGTDLASPAIA